MHIVRSLGVLVFLVAAGCAEIGPAPPAQVAVGEPPEPRTEPPSVAAPSAESSAAAPTDIPGKAPAPPPAKVPSAAPNATAMATVPPAAMTPATPPTTTAAAVPAKRSAQRPGNKPGAAPGAGGKEISPPPAATLAARSKAAPAASSTPPPAHNPGAAPSSAGKAASPPLDLAALEARLTQTKAIGVFTKITLKNQVDDLLNQFRAHYQGRAKTTLVELRQPFDRLLLKVLSLLQDGDPELARAIVASREALWLTLADPARFATL